MGFLNCILKFIHNLGNPFSFFIKRFIFYVIGIFILFSPLFSTQLPINHWVYGYLERMEAKGVIHHIRDGSKPFSRSVLAKYARQIDATYQSHPEMFTRVEVQRLERLLGEFYDELKTSEIAISKNEIEPHLFSWNQLPQYACFDVLMGGYALKRGKDAIDSERSVYSGYYGGILRAHAWGVDIYSDNRILSEWGSRTYLQHYNPSDGYPIGTSRDSSQATWDQSNSYLSYTYEGVQLLWGRDNVAWGPSQFGGLMLSGQAPEIDMLKLVVDLGSTRFTWLHGELRSDFEHKWLVSHRLEVSFNKSLEVGFHESLIYGNRGIEFAYLNPVLPYLVAEHTLGDQDNVTMGLDVDYHPGNGLKYYGDLFIDDLFAPWEVFDNFWGNKLAFTIGALWINPISRLTSDLRVEYTRIEPFVYTHEDTVNIFEHYDQGIGNQLQPNSDQVHIQFNYYPNVNCKIGAMIKNTRHGDGDRRVIHQLSDGDQKNFLKGIVDKRLELQLLCQYEFKRDMFISLIAGYQKNKNYKNIDGNNLTWPEAMIQFDINW